MGYEIKFIKQAEQDFAKLDVSIKKQVTDKMEKLSKNPYLGNPLGNKMGLDLTGFYKIYVFDKKYRIVYRIIDDTIEVVEIWGIGKRNREEIYKLLAKRIKNNIKD